MRGGSVERRCAVPAGKALFFPVVNAFAGFIYDPNPAPGDEPDVTGARADLKAWTQIYRR